MTLALKARPRPADLREFRYTRDDYATLTETGLFDGLRVELIHGRLIEMPPISEDHGNCVLLAARILRRIFPEDTFTVRPGLPFVASDDSEPEPDLCVVTGSAKVHTKHPRSCLLLIEVSLSTLEFDRKVKASVYAESGVEDFWIINLVDRVIEVHRQPRQGSDGVWGYAALQRVLPSDSVAPLADASRPIRVDELLP